MFVRDISLAYLQMFSIHDSGSRFSSNSFFPKWFIYPNRFTSQFRKDGKYCLLSWNQLNYGLHLYETRSASRSFQIGFCILVHAFRLDRSFSLPYPTCFLKSNTGYYFTYLNLCLTVLLTIFISIVQ